MIEIIAEEVIAERIGDELKKREKGGKVVKDLVLCAKRCFTYSEKMDCWNKYVGFAQICVNLKCLPKKLDV